MFQSPRFCHYPGVEPKSKAGRFLFRIARLLLVGLLILYAGACVLVFSFQRKLLYPGRVRSAEHVSGLAREARLERWTNSVGQPIGMKRLSPNQPSAGSVLIIYGNGGSATGCAHYVDTIQKCAAFDVFIVEYPGYADRPGAPNQSSLLAAAREAFQLLPTNQPIFLVGESLGTGIASYLAGEFPEKISGVMLLSPYARLADVAQYQYPWLPARWLLLDDFRSEEYLQSYHGSVGVMLDGQDVVVPERFGRRLFEKYSGPKQLWEFPYLGHIQIGEGPEIFWNEVIQFWHAEKSKVSG